MPFISSTTSAYGYGRNAVLNDIYFNKTVLLLHMNRLGGTGGGEPVFNDFFIDSSLYYKFVAPNGLVSLSTAQYRFGNASAFFDNTTAYLTVDHDDTLNFSTGDWTIELFCRIDPIETDILINKSIGLGFFGYQLRIVNNRFSAKGYGLEDPLLPKLVYELGEDVGPTVIPNTWYHVVVARQLSNFYLYVNGTLVDSAISSKPLYNSTGPLSIGGTSNGQGLTSGYIDELRITKGVCRYPNGQTFLVPASQFFDNSVIDN
jgi:hypothetical protein